MDCYSLDSSSHGNAMRPEELSNLRRSKTFVKSLTTDHDVRLLYLEGFVLIQIGLERVCELRGMSCALNFGSNRRSSSGSKVLT